MHIDGCIFLEFQTFERTLLLSVERIRGGTLNEISMAMFPRMSELLLPLERSRLPKVLAFSNAVANFKKPRIHAISSLSRAGRIFEDPVR